VSKPAHAILDFQARRVLSERSDPAEYQAERDRIRRQKDSGRMTITRAVPEGRANRQAC
jgi:hypothetical protein